jgi:predicted ATPase
MPCPREYGQVPTETDRGSHGARCPAALEDELAALRTQVARLRAETLGYLRPLDLTPQQGRPPGPEQTGIFDIVLVGGEAGIGKTRLITEAWAERNAVLRVVGGCVQLGEASLAYSPLVEALRGLRRRVGEKVLG